MTKIQIDTIASNGGYGRKRVLNILRCAIITEKVNICLTLYGPLPPPYFLLSKAEASCSLTPPPLQSQQNLHSDQSFSFDGTPKLLSSYNKVCAFCKRTSIYFVIEFYFLVRLNPTRIWSRFLWRDFFAKEKLIYLRIYCDFVTIFNGRLAVLEIVDSLFNWFIDCYFLLW